MANEIDGELSDLEEPFTLDEIDRMSVEELPMDSLLTSDSEEAERTEERGPGLNKAPLSSLHWKLLKKAGNLDERVLRKDSFKSDKELRRLRNTYYPAPDEITDTLKQNTLLWYEGGRHERKDRYPRGDEKYAKREIAGLYLKGVIPQAVRESALEGLSAMTWVKPRKPGKPEHGRPETYAAIERQASINGIVPGELTVGFTDTGSIERTKAMRNQISAFCKLEGILTAMNNVFSASLSLYFGEQNQPKSLKEREVVWANQKVEPADYGGISEQFRLLLTAFSVATLLKSCPAAIHKDSGNARKDQTSFGCLTSIGDGEFAGGEFCLLEYGLRIPVRPGDLLIAQTGREWHTNLTPVRGTKYSIVTYYRKGTGNPTKEDNTKLEEP